MGDTKIKIHHRVRLVKPVRNMYFLTLKGQFENLTTDQVMSRSGQGQIMTQVGQYAHPMKRLDEPSHLTPFARLSPSCRDVLAKNGLWRHLTSGGLSVTPDRQLHPDLNRWGEWPWSWKNWVVLIGLCETGSIFIFPHRLIMGRSRNWPNLRSPG